MEPNRSPIHAVANIDEHAREATPFALLLATSARNVGRSAFRKRLQTTKGAKSSIDHLNMDNLSDSGELIQASHGPRQTTRKKLTQFSIMQILEAKEAICNVIKTSEIVGTKYQKLVTQSTQVLKMFNSASSSDQSTN